MKLKIKLPSSLDATDISFDDQSNEISMNLVFYGDGKESVGGVVRTTDEADETLFRGIVKISGQTAKVSVVDRTKQVKPLIERKKKG